MAQRKQQSLALPAQRAATQSPVVSRHQQERPQFHNLDDTYDDACDFGKFALNPCACMVDSIAKCAPKLGTFFRNHLQQIIYMVAVFGSWAVVFTRLYPLITTDIPTVPSYHKSIGRIIFILCVVSWRYAANTCPGNITKANMAKYDNYAYDGWLYKDNNICPTLVIRKLARSKYDRYTNRHVPRFDHFCTWIGQPIGEENYRYFILFLVVHVFMCAYGTVVVYRLLCHMALTQSNGMLVVFQHEPVIAMTLALMFVMTILLGGFLVFHFILILRNTTTNEYQKWKDIKSWHKDASNKYHSSLQTRSCSSTTVEAAAGASVITTHHEAGGDEEDVQVKNRNTIADPGPLPQNAYDMGHVANIQEVMFPRSLRRRNHPHVE